jgi:hypothetical protein
MARVKTSDPVGNAGGRQINYLAARWDWIQLHTDGEHCRRRF